jgi:hypothetical protein
VTRFIVILALLTAAVSAARADSTMVDSAGQIDTLLFEKTNLFAGVSPVTNPEDFETRMYQKPTVALFKSMVVPGLGQLGNRRHIKALLFAGLDAWFIGSAIHYGGQAADFRDRWAAADDVADKNALYSLYEDRRDERNKFTWFAVIVTFISMFDAYVDAHLSGFPQAGDGQDLSLELAPVPGQAISATLTYSF